MFKLSKLLIKKGLKSVFVTSKVFSILIMILIILSGATYTMLESASSSFSRSYNTVSKEGKLHDFMVRENFKFTDDQLNKSNLTLQIKGANGIYADVTDQNIKDNAHLNQKGDQYVVDFAIDKSKTTGIFNDLKNDQLNLQVVFDATGMVVTDDNVRYVNNRLKAIKSNAVSFLEKHLVDEYLRLLKQQYGKYLDATNTESLFVTKESDARKVVLYDRDAEDSNVNNMVIYDGTKNFTTPLTDEQFLDALKNVWLEGHSNTPFDSYTLVKYKGYKQSLEQTGSFDGIDFFDPSSFQAIVSPAFANAHGKQAISVEELNKMFEKDHNHFQNMTPNDWEKYKRNVVYVGSTPYFIIGIGTTPDFAYPIVDASMPIVNDDNQAIVFVNKRGYSRIYDAFRTAPQENYISVRFKAGVAEADRSRIMKEIEEKTRGSQTSTFPVSAFPPNINIVVNANDKNERMLLANGRTIVLDQIKTTVKTLSITTTTLLIIFLTSIVIMIFKVLIGGTRKVMATMLALGYTKTQIALSNALAALVLAGITSVIGYLIGFGSQFLFINAFSSQWTLPAYATPFSLMSLLVVLLIPTIGMFAIIWLITLFEMRYPLPLMLSENVGKSFTLFTRTISKFKFLGIQGKYILSLSIRNIWKLGLIAISTCISITAISIGFGTIGKAQQAYNATNAMTNYQFAIDLNTPTKEGGQYNPLYTHAKDDDPTWPATHNYISPNKLDHEMLPHITGEASWHVPDAKDGSLVLGSNVSGNLSDAQLKEVANYLNNKLQLKGILISKDTAFGGVNPWEIAERLMPENQRNEANADFQKILDGLRKTDRDKVTTEEVNRWLNANIKKYVPYIISYNQVLVDPSDELYTYVKATRNGHNEEVKIYGVTKDSKMVNIKSALDKMAKSKEEFPIAVNKYIAKKWGVSTGSKVKLSIDNLVDKSNGSTKTITATVVSVVDGYDSRGIFTLKEYANKVLGLDIQKGFNGVFSTSDAPATLKTLPLYSESGIYTGTSSYSGDWETYLENYLKSSNWTNSNIKTPAEYFSRYSRTPYVSLIGNVSWDQIDKQTFHDINKISSAIITTIEAISITISILFTIIVATLIFRTNRKKISALWTLGYRKREIFKMFISMYFIPILIGLAISVPIAYAILEGLRIFIMSFGNVLIPLTLSWWIPLAAFGIIGFIFVVSTLIIVFTQQQSNALAAFKGD